MSETIAPPRPRPARAPLEIKQHQTSFQVALVSVQALTAAVTMVLALVGAVYVQDEQEDRRQARMTRAWTLLYDTREELFNNVGQVEALQSLHESGANLRRVNLDSRFLQGVKLPGTDFQGASFRRSKLMQADLSNVNLRGADLVRADLTEVDLTGADFTGAALSGTTLTDADLTGADLSDAGGLTAEQIAEACADPADPPSLPAGLPTPPAC